MKHRLRRVLPCLLLCVTCTVARAEGSCRWTEVEAQAAFAEASLRHQSATRSLLQTRGMPSTRLQPAMDWNDARQHLANLPPDSALLLYDVAGDELRVWLVGERGTAWECTSGAAARVSVVAGRLRSALRVDTTSRAPRLRGAARVASAAATPRVLLDDARREASELLLPGDVGAAIEALQVRNLVIVPWGAIATVPFALLNAGKDAEPLVKRVSASVSPSLRDVGQPVDAWRLPRNALVVGNPAYADPEWDLPDLPGARAEASEAARLLGTGPLIGPAATIDRVRAAAKVADFIYLATHGVASAERPLEESFVALTPTAAAPGRWTAREIQQEPISASTVVLSACQTGLGATVDGGVIGLARAFQLAGAHEVVMSLWSIDDTATARVMADFVSRLAEGPYTAETLRRAQEAARAAGLQPAQWAAFTVFAGSYAFTR